MNSMENSMSDHPGTALGDALGADLSCCPKRGDIDQLDRSAIAELIQRERSARDAGRWDVMAACFHPEAKIDVSWFNGGAADFVAATKRVAEAGKTLSLHRLSPAVVTLNGDRALAETDAEMLGFSTLDGVEVCGVHQVRLLWRAQTLDERWMIAGLHCVYVRGLLLACNPARLPIIDEAVLAQFRPSYRYLSYVLTKNGMPPRDDLPGVDRPESIIALRAAETAWLSQRRP
jgi:hypothetical protein